MVFVEILFGWYGIKWRLIINNFRVIFNFVLCIFLGFGGVIFIVFGFFFMVFEVGEYRGIFFFLSRIVGKNLVTGFFG